MYSKNEQRIFIVFILTIYKLLGIEDCQKDIRSKIEIYVTEKKYSILVARLFLIITAPVNWSVERCLFFHLDS